MRVAQTTGMLKLLRTTFLALGLGLAFNPLPVAGLAYAQADDDGDDDPPPPPDDDKPDPIPPPKDDPPRCSCTFKEVDRNDKCDVYEEDPPYACPDGSGHKGAHKHGC